jgi:primosomal protein N' (replication factor Y)
MNNKFIKILLPVFLPEALIYGVPENMDVKPGDIVRVPLGNKSIIGVVLEDEVKFTGSFKIKNITAKLEIKPLSKELLKFILWVAEYNFTSPGSILKMVLSSTEALNPQKMIKAYKISEVFPSIKITASRQKILDLLKDDILTSNQIVEKANVTKAAIKGLLTSRAIEEINIQPQTEAVVISKLNFVLSEQQQEAADILCKRIEAKKYSTILLDGVTGSGKTEVYFKAIEKALEQHNSQILIMLPEIALTTQIISRFKDKFGFEPTQWHSGLTVAMREKNWRDIFSGRARLIIGARSALFLPYLNLRLMVIDEEHDSSYKQEEQVIYHARDMAVVRAAIEKFTLILASATPSLETVENVKSGKYEIIKLPSRFGEAVMPEIKLVDMRLEKLRAGKWISNTMRKLIAANMEQKKQSMLFLNRRGYAPLTLCRECGYRFKCPDCSSWLVEHKSHNKILCHHCGYSQAIPESCPDCGKEDMLVSCGPGVERIAEEVRGYFPNANISLLTADNMTNINIARDKINQVTSGEVDIIIGTQIMAKGYHFPNLTHVGIIDADLGMEGGDLRVAERTYQLLQQVSGRAGREEIQGQVIIQSYMPDNSVMQALLSGKRDFFVESEINSRKMAKMPPYGRLAAIIISGKNEQQTAGVAKSLAVAAPIASEIRLLGPVKAPIYMLRGNYRYRILIKTSRTINIQKWLKSLISSVKVPSSVVVKIDIDPYSFM